MSYSVLVVAADRYDSIGTAYTVSVPVLYFGEGGAESTHQCASCDSAPVGHTKIKAHP